MLQDAYGNRYTYARLGSVQRIYPVPKEDAASAIAHASTAPSRYSLPTRKRPGAPRLLPLHGSGD